MSQILTLLSHGFELGDPGSWLMLSTLGCWSGCTQLWVGCIRNGRVRRSFHNSGLQRGWLQDWTNIDQLISTISTVRPASGCYLHISIRLLYNRFDLVGPQNYAVEVHEVSILKSMCPSTHGPAGLSWQWNEWLQARVRIEMKDTLSSSKILTRCNRWTISTINFFTNYCNISISSITNEHHQARKHLD